jgi:uncharacterized membrane protein
MERFPNVEEGVQQAAQWLRLGVEAVGASIVGLGALIGVYLFFRALVLRQTANFNAIRLVVARYLALALEFQLGADILSTAIAPGWQEIGKLGAIAIIRTALNYFLSREMREERGAESPENAVHKRAARGGGVAGHTATVRRPAREETAPPAA